MEEEDDDEEEGNTVIKAGAADVDEDDDVDAVAIDVVEAGFSGVYTSITPIVCGP